MTGKPCDQLSQFTVQLAKQKYATRLRDAPRLTESECIVDTEWRDKFQAQRDAGKRPRLTLADAINRYCDTIAPMKRVPARAKDTRNILYRWAEMIGPRTLVHKVDEATLSECRDKMIAEGLKPRSINRYMWEFGAVLRTCCENWRIIKRVPRLKRFSYENTFRYLTEEEEVRLLAQCDLPLRRLVLFLVGTGARKSEATGLTWDDVIPGTDGGRTWVRFRKTKNGRPHTVPLPRNVETMLAEMRVEPTDQARHVFTQSPSRNRRNVFGRLFLQKGEPAQFLYPDHQFRTARARAGLHDVTIHSLRHTYASRLIMRGVPIYEVAKLMNHADIEHTMRYAHMSALHLEKSVDVLDPPAVLACLPLTPVGLPERYAGVL